MFNKTIYIFMITLLLTTSVVQAEVVRTTAYGNGADTYLANDGQSGDYGPDSIHGEDTSLRAFRQLADTRSKTGYIRFDISEVTGNMSGTILTFDATFLKGAAKSVDVYGLIDGEDDFWDESTLTYNTAPGVLTATLGNYTIDTSKTTLLGTITTPGAGEPYPVSFSSDPAELPLETFLELDTNGLVTFLFIGADNEGEVASKEHETFTAPTLTLPYATIGPSAEAAKPHPADKAEDVLRDVVLMWTPGAFAYKHDVYIGNDFDDVLSATPTNDPHGVYLGRFDPNFYPDSGALRLDFDQTYYWRIDEVNAPPDTFVYTGSLWSFTTESFAYPISAEAITATASSSAPGQGPENTINGSGLNADDLHSIQSTDMWLTSAGESLPAWIKYEFDKPYQLHQMLVWNYNGESILSMFSIKDVDIEYSTDDTNWTKIDSVSEFPQATGADGYASNITVEFGAVAAKYVRITANSNWGIGNLFNQYGLSEVRFMFIPVSARNPSPESGATDVAINALLSWSAGRGAVEHDVYFSNDQQSVTDGTTPVTTVDQSSYGPLFIDLGRNYYWRIDEVNNNEADPIWPGNTWSFSTTEYLVVDDFELYNDIEQGQEGSNLVYLTWTDGYDNPAINGSTIGYVTVPSLETNTVHGGRRSVPISYDNTMASSSEVTVNTNDLEVGPDWTVGAPESLVLWIYGDPNNSAEQMYVKVNNSRVNFEGDLTQAQWQEFSIDLASLGINLSNVTTLTIGFERAGATGGMGTIFLDDIQLFTALNGRAAITAWHDR
jgi:hypothetical protein